MGHEVSPQVTVAQCGVARILSVWVQTCIVQQQGRLQVRARTVGLTSRREVHGKPLWRAGRSRTAGAAGCVTRRCLGTRLGDEQAATVRPRDVCQGRRTGRQARNLWAYKVKGPGWFEFGQCVVPPHG